MKRKTPKTQTILKNYPRWLAQQGDKVSFGHREYSIDKVYDVNVEHGLYLGKPVSEEEYKKGFRRIAYPIYTSKIVGRLGVYPEHYNEFWDSFTVR